MPEVVVKVVGDDTTIAYFEETALRAIDIEPLQHAIFGAMRRIEVQQFDSEGGRSGHKWPPLDNRYMFSKWTAGLDLRIMRATNDLFNSLTDETEFSVHDASPNSFRFGSTLTQFAVHQDWNPESDFPERRPVDFTEADITLFGDMMAQYIIGSIDRRGQRQRRYPAGTIVDGQRVGGRYIGGSQ